MPPIKKPKKLSVPSAAEVKKANAAGCTAREKLARKHGLSGAAAAAIGLGPSCIRKPRKKS